ncbi:hypothetical protein V5E97_10625 [Singulisphaera sp. Ch08]|uniref:Uncharacterized protein n=1 Tax=Singulisphaera sp. Ch08 TaxID=3120278 RepID=A0AAU7CMB2_9BACT
MDHLDCVARLLGIERSGAYRRFLRRVAGRGQRWSWDEPILTELIADAGGRVARILEL